MGGPATTGSPFPTSATATTFYRIVSTCTTSALSATSSVISYQVNTCTGSIVLSDAFGDGWNGATMQLYINGALFQTFGSTFTAGASQTINFCLPAASTYALVFNNGGAYSSEVGITSLTINGTNVYSVGAGLAAVGSTLTTGTACPPHAQEHLTLVLPLFHQRRDALVAFLIYLPLVYLQALALHTNGAAHQALQAHGQTLLVQRPLHTR
jgi:hypothetical protein